MIDLNEGKLLGSIKLPNAETAKRGLDSIALDWRWDD
ncbi:hypothetical protein BJ970_006666 [Saccharopolyspora phatthalungensis]|uniref:Uncharacterized protein n=1 Tax=Saccharopolyspora phatthalungensis TaxID=664693 RepID=A0A840QG45_9PSEU|nr:hypothetical protein [Saccharopolyspora phatthalungensis]